jgi:glycosyltransferase involved in cell wall biosynthesis
MILSIITPCLNAGATLREALESVNFPSTGEVEHLLIDACSKDSTLTEAALYPHLRVLSEPDKGIYDGMNKGGRLARGQWLLFLQADDWLPRGTLEAYFQAIAEHPYAEMICGGAEAVRKGKHEWKLVWSVNELSEKKLSVRNIALGEPMINARLIRKDIFERLGGFSPEYLLASDRDFLLRAAESGIRQIEISEVTYRYRWHESSSTMTDNGRLSRRLREENLKIARRHHAVINGKERGIVSTWHARLAVEKAMNALENAEFNTFSEAFCQGLSANPWWPLHFLVEVMSSLPGFVARGCVTRSQCYSKK